MPKRRDGRNASTTNPAHWLGFDEAKVMTGVDGIGFVFTPDDPFVGVDLDDCIKDGVVEPWAQEIIDQLGSYAEISISGTGVKIIARGKLPFSGRKVERDGLKIELYQQARYFWVTGQALNGSTEVVDAQPAIDSIVSKYFGQVDSNADPELLDDVKIERLKQRVLELPEAVSGAGGHNAALHAACEILRMGVDGAAGRALLDDYNVERCTPAWSKRELDHKWRSAERKILREGSFGSRPVDGGEFTTIEQPRQRYNVLTSAELAGGDYSVRFLIDRVLVAEQPLILAGPPKAMKTSVAVAAAVALASGTKFLGEFNVAERQRVLMLSGESGLGTLQDTANRICQASGVRLDALDGLLWSEDLPKLGNAESMAGLAELIADHGVQTLVVDPAYLAMPGADAANLMVMGELLRSLGDVCRPAGVTPIVLHHTKKGRVSKRLGLADIAWSGFSEWARQWWLLDRREPFKRGTHRLWLDVGGSAGHHGDFAVDIEEGVQCQLAGRTWRVDVSDAEAAFLAAETRKEQDAAAKGQAKLETRMAACRSQLLLNPDGLTKTALRTRAGISDRDIDAVLAAMIDAGQVERCDLVTGNHKSTKPGVRIVPDGGRE
ncbi:MAG: AAA family ATPase [Planctomycetota bacterium]